MTAQAILAIRDRWEAWSWNAKSPHPAEGPRLKAAEPPLAFSSLFWAGLLTWRLPTRGANYIF